MIKKILSVIFILCFVMTGCSNQTISNEVYFLNFKPEIADVYNEVAKAYKQETGKEIKVVTAASGTYEQTLKSEIAKRNPPTIFQVNGPIGFSSWKNYCTDLTDTKLYENLTDKGLAIKNDGRVYAIPYAIEGYGIIYNNAIMEKYFDIPTRKTGLNSADEIDSFDKLKEVVEDMQSMKDELGIEGVFASTSLATGDQWRWQTHLLNIPMYYEFLDKDNSNESTITTGVSSNEVEFKYSKNYKNLFDLYIENSVSDKKVLGSKSTSDSMAEFALGKCVMVQNGDWAWSQIKDVSGNVVKENDIKFLPLFMDFDDEENQGICIGTENYLAINDKASDESKADSLAFLEWLFTSATGKDFVTNSLGFNAPFSSFSDNEKPNDPLNREVLRWLDSGKKNIEWTFQSFPSEEFKNYFGDALLQYAQSNTDWENVETTVKEKWKSESIK